MGRDGGQQAGLLSIPVRILLKSTVLIVQCSFEKGLNKQKRPWLARLKMQFGYFCIFTVVSQSYKDSKILITTTYR